MNKQQALNYITSAMTLRKPQAQSLQIYADYLESEAGKLLLNKMIKSERKGIKEIEAATTGYFKQQDGSKNFSGFDGRAFPSFTFALATGVGKTKLMGAFVTYLYLVHGIQHFLIVSPGNTIYRKLVEDFSKAMNPKYVFRGIEELNTSTVKIITKDNYINSQKTSLSLFKNKIEINILNIQQFAQKEVEKEKGITKYNEELGESYFDYLASMDDLVVMLDESHHYHADAAFDSLDRMGPLAALEFTATPYTGKTIGRGKTKDQEVKSNIVCLYNLGNAIRDKYVKDPWVGTEADVDFKEMDSESLDTDKRKLQLAAYFHERAKIAIEEYALENDVRAVKPVMLVVAKDTEHAHELKMFIDSHEFRGGQYKGKVIEVHTKTKGEETDEAVQKLISLEEPNNFVEIVIHVNMLKEGWDVANIYTIVPLRQSAAQILTEQTIGRGLRLPYLDRVSYFDNETRKMRYELVDRVMIVAHEKYSQVVEKAKNSVLIQPTNIEQVSKDEIKEVKSMLESKPVVLEKIEEEIRASQVIMSDITEIVEKELAQTFDESTTEEVRVFAVEQRVAEKVEQVARVTIERTSLAQYHKQDSQVAEAPFASDSLFTGMSKNAQGEMSAILNTAQQTLESRNIPIPRMTLIPHPGNIVIKSFKLDTSKLRSYATHVTILEQSLQGESQTNLFGASQVKEGEVVVTRVESLGSGSTQKLENFIVLGLIDFPLVDYDEQKVLLNALAQDAVNYYKTFAKNHDNLRQLIENNFHEIAEDIYRQMLVNKEEQGQGYLDPQIRESSSCLEEYKIATAEGEVPVSLESQVDTFSRTKIYTNFKKACHPRYKFDSSDEARFAYLLDRDDAVEDWLRPAPRQFKDLQWRDEHGSYDHHYEPDFIVELESEIVMVEVKPEGEILLADVQSKKQTAEKYCELVSENIGKFGIAKPWRYVIVPTQKITTTSTIRGLLKAQ